MSKRIEVVCTPEIKAIFVTALYTYTDVAFPCGSADCSLVAREAMLDTLGGFEREYADSDCGHAGYNKRLRAMFKEGIRLHYRLQEAEHGRPMAAECQLLLEVAEGIPHDDADLAAARRADCEHFKATGVDQDVATGNRK